MYEKDICHAVAISRLLKLTQEESLYTFNSVYYFLYDSNICTSLPIGSTQSERYCSLLIRASTRYVIAKYQVIHLIMIYLGFMMFVHRPMSVNDGKLPVSMVYLCVTMASLLLYGLELLNCCRTIVQTSMTVELVAHCCKGEQLYHDVDVITVYFLA